MDLQIRINPALNRTYKVDLPHPFLNRLLETELGSQQKCVLIKTIYGLELATTLHQFTEQQDCIDVSREVCDFLHLEEGDYVHVSYIEEPPIPARLELRPETEAFSQIENIKEELETLISTTTPCLTTGSTMYVREELMHVVALYNHEGEPLLYGLTDNSELEVDFLESFESIRKREELEEQLRLEKEVVLEYQRQQRIAKEELAKKREAERLARDQAQQREATLGGRHMSREERLAHILKRINESKKV